MLYGFAKQREMSRDSERKTKASQKTVLNNCHRIQFHVPRIPQFPHFPYFQYFPQMPQMPQIFFKDFKIKICGICGIRGKNGFRDQSG